MGGKHTETNAQLWSNSTIRPRKIYKNQTFIGREAEIQRLTEIVNRQEACMIVVHGRRRTGKTELLEQYFRDRKVLKFEQGASILINT